MYNIFLDEKRTFQHHIDNAFCRGSAGIAVMKKLRHSFGEIEIYQNSRLTRILICDL